ncbi:hypothetical protein LLG95_15630 [bacterium]|nr:hypothetical protein [bacterium]
MTATTASKPAGAKPASDDQQRCDQLFLSLLHKFDEYGDYRQNIRSYGPDDKYVDSRRQLAELAAFYEKGIRVSDAARHKFKLPYGREIGLMQDTIVNYAIGQRYRERNLRAFERPHQPQPVTPEKVDRMLEAMRMRRVTGCPAWPNGQYPPMTEVNWQLAWMLDPGGKNLSTPPPLPRPIETVPLELLAARDGRAEYETFLVLLAEMEAEYVNFRSELADPGKFFKWDWNRQQSWLTRYWNRGDFRSRVYYAGEFCGSVFDTVAYHRRRIEDSEYAMKQAGEMLDYIHEASTNGPIQRVTEEKLWQLKEYNDQIESRALAAALELRRGKPIPPPEAITADAYLYDLITRQPMLMFRSSAGPGMTRLHIAWPLRTMEKMPSITALVRRAEGPSAYCVNVILNSTHPGLDTVPQIQN